MAPALILSAILARAALDPSTSSSASPTVASSAIPATPAPLAALAGVTLGSSSKEVRAQLGKPREILSASLGDVWRFSADGGNATLDVLIAGDTVIDVAVRSSDGKQSTLADPNGGALGMTAQALQAVRGAPVATLDGGEHLAYADRGGARWFYTIVNGTVTRIELASPAPPPAAAQVIADARHDGSSVEHALIVNAATESDGVQAEMSYIGGLSCDESGRWQVTGQELVPAGGRYYDLLHAVCSVSKHPRDFYFDVTSFFGK